jgi:hypothetical protein
MIPKVGFVIITTIILLLPFIGGNIPESKSISMYIENNNLPVSHLIQNVPYVSQETDFFCTYACPTMIFNYYGFNTSLKEILFYSGVGYSTVYSHKYLKRFLIGCTGTCNWNADRSFLAEQFGLKYKEDRINILFDNKEEKWNLYWYKIKENISNNRPIITYVSPTFLSSLRYLMKDNLNIPDFIFENIPDLFWGIFPSIPTHMITIIGYNETNQTICYNDPSAELFGNASYGTYAWMDLSLFRKSMNYLSKRASLHAYKLGSFKETSNEAYDKSEAFLRAYERNIEKMKGNSNAYDEHILKNWSVSYLGIEAFKELNRNLDNGIFQRFSTIWIYKFISTFFLFPAIYLVYYFCELLIPSVINIDDFQEQMNYCIQLSIEKNYMVDYLNEVKNTFNNSFIKDLCNQNSDLLYQEKIFCEKLGYNFSLFLSKGLFISFPRAFIVADKMQMHLDDIISIEEQLISLS